MLLKVLPKEIFEFLGHDGSEILWPEFEDPQRRRGFHIQEIVEFALTKHIMFLPIEPLPALCPTDDWPLDKAYVVERKTPFEDYIVRRPGLLLGTHEGRRHAVAWDRHKIHDPMGRRYGIEEFVIHVFYAMY